MESIENITLLDAQIGFGIFGIVVAAIISKKFRILIMLLLSPFIVAFGTLAGTVLAIVTRAVTGIVMGMAILVVCYFVGQHLKENPVQVYKSGADYRATHNGK